MKLTTSAARPRSAIEQDQVAADDDDVYLLGHFVVSAVASNVPAGERCPVRLTSRPALKRSGTEPWYTIGMVGLVPLMLCSLNWRPADRCESPLIGPMTLPVSDTLSVRPLRLLGWSAGVVPLTAV